MQTSLIAQLVLSASFQTVYFVNNYTFVTISRVHLANTSASPVTVQVCYVPHGQSPGVTNAVLWNFSIAGNDFIEFGEGEIIGHFNTIQALASVPSVVNLYLSAMGTP